ncbi:Serine/threonine-protein phosphatase PP1-2 [Tritrichomonas foetus]|uniref:Serine/threonine-protein phosphatase n=1 Tax=Tritrichomonas foetus TaxID=1144522 RepID=A0A1J4JHG7_9EUKA|nr:Serine/threonine-protein phosphatase PP1-2 [Tritrichomonas foetus]|eukprot:OHS98594.1 Serine/threonine-protein phosphatase PP1-2 [Tritrichomonas foetus]
MYAFTRSILFSFRSLMQKDSHEIISLMKTVGLPHFDEHTISDLCIETINKLKEGGTLLKVSCEFSPVVIVGDIHGSIVDLLRIFGTYGLPPETKYVFLGDYVDRGDFSVETLALLFSALCTYPEHIFLLRGNHEFRSVCANYGFRDEVLDSYSPDLLNLFMDVFSYLPLAAVVNESIFCVHGGLSSQLNSLEDISRIERPIEDFSNPLVEDLVWSDPSRIGSCEYIPSIRNRGCVFGSAAVNAFYAKTGTSAIVRGHSFVKEGVEIYPYISLASVFSSSNSNFANNQVRSHVGVILVDEESNMAPEILEPSERINKNDVKTSDSQVVLPGMWLRRASSITSISAEQRSAGPVAIKGTPQRHSSSKRSLPTIKFRF